MSADFVTVQAAAAQVEAAAVDDADVNNRVDMQTMHVMTIDDASTSEIDDGKNFKLLFFPQLVQ